MSEQTILGKLLTGDESRDAIHIAVAPVMAGENIRPGQHIGLLSNGRAGITSNPIGIADPFLKHSIREGEYFYLVLYPNTITSLKHQWAHPAFPEVYTRPDMKASVEWLEELADECGMSYEDLLSEIPSGSIHTGDREMYDARDSEDIAQHYFNVTGVKIHKPIRFSCAC